MDPVDVKNAVKEAMREEMQAFYIDRETHYLDHVFLKNVREIIDGCQSAFVKTIVSAVAVLIISGIGLVVYLMKNPIIKGG